MLLFVATAQPITNKSYLISCPLTPMLESSRVGV
jgi:hypothetical protein